MKYLVMECHPSYAVVLSEDGRFLKAANLHYQPGQTVTDIVEMRLPQTASNKTAKHRWAASLAAMAACMTLVVAAVFHMGQSPYASVYLTINPEVRIDVNRKDIVVDLEGVNRDGELLIADYTYQKTPLDDVMDDLVDRAIDMGYLHEGGRIALTLDAEDERWVAEHTEHLDTHLQEHLTEKISVTIQINSSQDAPAPTPPQSSYGESDYGPHVPAPTQPVIIPIPSDDEADADHSDYGDEDTDEDSSDYGDDNADEDISDHGDDDTDEDISDHGDDDTDEGISDYEDEDDDTDEGISDYGDDDTDEGASDYEDDDTDEGVSDYEEEDTSDYETSEPDDEDDD